MSIHFKVYSTKFRKVTKIRNSAHEHRAVGSATAGMAMAVLIFEQFLTTHVQMGIRSRGCIHCWPYRFKVVSYGPGA